MLNVDPVAVIKKYGLRGTFVKTLEIALKEVEFRYCRFKYRKIRRYQNLTPEEMIAIETGLKTSGILISDVEVDIVDFREFEALLPFPDDYHGGIHGGVWNEKIVEHYISYKLLKLDDFKADDVYIDVAACASPWAKMLREKLQIQAFAIDIELSGAYQDIDYYRCENATHTSFPDRSVKGMSLQCAFEMFIGNDDVLLLTEMERILQKGGKAVIVPLYMHTHYCSYSSPEYWGKGYSDSEAEEYINMDCRGIPSSRKYDVKKLQERILRRIEDLGMRYNIHVLRNAQSISSEIYCHFILEITK